MMRDNIERFTKVEINIHCSPFIHQASNFLTEHHQFGQVRFPILNPWWPAWDTSWSFICLRIVFHDLSMDWGKVDLLFGLQIILFVSLEDRRDICFLSFIKNLSEIPWPSLFLMELQNTAVEKSIYQLSVYNRNLLLSTQKHKKVRVWKCQCSLWSHLRHRCFPQGHWWLGTKSGLNSLSKNVSMLVPALKQFL